MRWYQRSRAAAGTQSRVARSRFGASDGYTDGMNRAKVAWGVAIAADALQIAFLPAFAGGFASPLSDGLDIAVAILMLILLGWHIAFLPTAIAEIVPALNLFPTWTAAVFFVTRRRAAKGDADQRDFPSAAP
jgi:hypothetical protein